MKIRDYFKQEQKIDATVWRGDEYKNVQTIQFGPDYLHNIEITIARIDEDIWGLGWQIKDGSKVQKQKCSTHASFRGRIDLLIYGITKLIVEKVSFKHGHTHTNLIREIAQGALESAENYVKNEPYKFKPITI